MIESANYPQLTAPYKKRQTSSFSFYPHFSQSEFATFRLVHPPQLLIHPPFTDLQHRLIHQLSSSTPRSSTHIPQPHFPQPHVPQPTFLNPTFLPKNRNQKCPPHWPRSPTSTGSRSRRPPKDCASARRIWMRWTRLKRSSSRSSRRFVQSSSRHTRYLKYFVIIYTIICYHIIHVTLHFRWRPTRRTSRTWSRQPRCPPTTWWSCTAGMAYAWWAVRSPACSSVGNGNP